MDFVERFRRTRPVRFVIRNGVRRFLDTLILLYFGFLFAWFVCYLMVPDATCWMFVANALAAYFFLPVPLILGVAWWIRSFAVLAASAAAAVLFVGLFGSDLCPRLRSIPEGRKTTLRVLTFNVCATNENHAGLLRVLRECSAHVVALQEVTPSLARVISEDLAQRYPHQFLAPADDVTGMGILSKYPIRPLPSPVRGTWGSIQQLVEIDLGTARTYLLNIHLPVMAARAGVSAATASNRQREAQAESIARFARDCGGPFIVAGDLNATPMNRACRIMADTLTDTWREAGMGLGHTFPVTRMYGLPLARWLLRIDFVSCSKDWDVLSAATGPLESGSDHCPVVAEVGLRSVRTPTASVS